MTKLTNLPVRTAKTQISLGIHPVWPVFAVRMKKGWVLSYSVSAQRRHRSDWADAQADLSLRWVHVIFKLVGFVIKQLICKENCFQPFGEKLEREVDPDKKAMYKRMKASVTAGVEEMEKAMNNSVDDVTLEQARQVINWVEPTEWRVWLGQAIVLGSFQCRGVLLLWHMVGQGPAVLAAGVGQVDCIFCSFFFHLIYAIFLF